MPELSDWITMGVVVAIFALLWNAHRDMSRDMTDLRKDMADLRERMARLEGLFQGFVGRRDKPPAEQARDRAFRAGNAAGKAISSPPRGRRARRRAGSRAP